METDTLRSFVVIVDGNVETSFDDNVEMPFVMPFVVDNPKYASRNG